MKQRTKSMLIAALVFFCIGVLLTTISYIIALSTRADIYNDSNRRYEYTTSQYSLDDMMQLAEANETAKLTELSIQLNSAVVEFQKTDGATQFEFYNVDKNNFNFSFSAGTLQILEPEAVNRYGFTIENGSITFNGLRHIFNGAATRANPKIIIRWNPGEELASLRINVTTGSITVSDMPENAALSATLSVGNLSVSNCNSPECALDARVSVGSITAQNNTFATSNYNSTCGNIRLDASLGSVRVTTTVGNITFYGDFDENTCHAQANTTIGSITSYTGEKCGTQLNISAENETSNAQLTTTLGSIKLQSIGA